MGVNYYTRLHECEHCERYEEIHLGKNSYGWQFSFQYNGGQYYKNIKEMKEWLKDKRIFNEYDEEVSYKDFWKLVRDKQKERLNHYDYVKEKHPDSLYHEHKIDGYSFTDCYFS